MLFRSHIEAAEGTQFGIWTGRSIHLPTTRLTLLYGRNEAGKSTLSRLMTWLLIGPDTEASELRTVAELSQVASGRMSGLVGDEPFASVGAFKELKQNREQPKALQVEFGGSLDQQAWFDQLRLPDGKHYLKLYRISGTRLHGAGAVEEALQRFVLGGDGEIADPREVAARLRKRARLLASKGTGSQPTIGSLAVEISEARARLRDATSNAEQFAETDARIRDLERDLSAARVQADLDRTVAETLRRLLEAQPIHRRWRDLSAMHRALDSVPEPWRSLVADSERIVAEIDRYVEDREALRERVAAHGNHQTRAPERATDEALALLQTRAGELRAARDSVALARTQADELRRTVVERRDVSDSVLRQVSVLAGAEIASDVVIDSVDDPQLLALIERRSEDLERFRSQTIDVMSGANDAVPEIGGVTRRVTASPRWVATTAGVAVAIGVLLIAVASLTQGAVSTIALVLGVGVATAGLTMAVVRAIVSTPDASNVAPPTAHGDRLRAEAESALVDAIKTLGSPQPSDLAMAGIVARNWLEAGRTHRSLAEAIARAEVAEKVLRASEESHSAATARWISLLGDFAIDPEADLDRALVLAANQVADRRMAEQLLQATETLAVRRRSLDERVAAVCGTVDNWTQRHCDELGRMAAIERQRQDLATRIGAERHALESVLIGIVVSTELEQVLPAIAGAACGSDHGVAPASVLRLVGHTELITAQSQVESRLAQTEEMIEELQGTLSVSRARAKALSNERRLEDTNFEVSSLADQQYALARDAAALALAAELLSDAADRFERRTQPALLAAAAARVATVIPGARRLAVRRGDDGVRLYVMYQDGSERPLSQLSTGARAVIYLACRLAMIDVDRRRTGIALPIILDEPFAHLDAERRRSALQLLVDMSQEHQVLMFTCSDSVRAMVAEMPLLGDDVADIGILNLSQG